MRAPGAQPPRPDGRRRCRYAVLGPLLLALCLAPLAGCSRPAPDHKAELGALLEQGKLDEVVRRSQEYLSRGERSPWIQYHLGLALLRQDEDRRAADAMQAAAKLDSTLARPMASALKVAAQSDLKAGWEGRASSRMELAYELDPQIELENMLEPVAQATYSQRDYRRALPLYEQLDSRGGGTDLKLQEWRYRRGFCLQELGRDDEALDVYRSFLKQWSGTPGGYKRRVMWRYQSLLLDRAESVLSSDPGAALALAQEALAPGWNLELLQRGRVLAGGAEEAMGKPQEALRWYATTLKATAAGDAGAQYVEQAKQRIEALRAMSKQ